MVNLSVEPDDLTAEAQITDQDLAVARRFWQKWGTPLLRSLLAAKPKPSGNA